jgi:hypothetical protein
MPPSKPKPRLESSWVVEGEDESPDHSEEEYPLPQAAPRRSRRHDNKPPEPELVMPSLDSQTLEASWADTTSRAMRSRRGRRPAGTKPRLGAYLQNEETESSTEIARTKKRLGITASSSQGLVPAIKSNPQNANTQNIMEVCLGYSVTMGSWLLEVLGSALLILKKPASYLLAAWLLFGMSVMVRNLVTTSVYASLSPICRVPGVSYLDLPFCAAHNVDTNNGAPPPVEFDRLMTVQAHFGQVMEESAGRVSLPMDMKRSESSIRDLRQLVRYSDLSSK